MLMKFGIPSLDELIEVPNVRRGTEHDSGATAPKTESIAILGPDGTGKSVMSLHLASRYALECFLEKAKQAIGEKVSGNGSEELPPRILYISSDLKHASANRIWESFKLAIPASRHIPFERTPDTIRRISVKEEIGGVLLENIHPDAPEQVINYLLGLSELATGETVNRSEPSVGFLDLASRTAGDDWGLLNSILVKLQAIDTWRGPDGECLPHLVIVDSVAGFETFVGKLDAFGNEQTRRARIAQCIRNAGDKVNLVFVVEESTAAEKLPEEYVTDIVLALRKRTDFESTLLTVEVQKARSREHAKGEHPYEIRSEAGTSTGMWANVDTPASKNAYVEIFHSLAHRNIRISAERGTGPLEQNDTVATFGLPHLDNLLHKSGKRTHFGLKAATVTSMIGEPGTGKTPLAYRFLAWNFAEVVRDYVLLRGLQLVSQPGMDIGNVRKSKAVRRALYRTATALQTSILEWTAEITQDGELIPEAEWDKTFEALTVASAFGLKKTQQKILDSKDFGGPQIDSKPDGNWDSRRKAKEKEDEAQRDTSQSRHHFENGDKDIDRDIEEEKNEEEKEEKKRVRKLTKIFCHPNLVRPGILLTTSDPRDPGMARICYKHLTQEIEKAKSAFKEETGIEPEYGDSLEREIVWLLDQQLIVRRYDMHGAPAEAIFHVIHRNVVEANRLLFGAAYPPNRDLRYRKCDRIRLVIDDLRVLSKINPSIVKDGAFLPFLSFFLEREGLIALILHTDSAKLNAAMGDETTRSLVSLLRRTILTWNVPFEGRRRVAITVMPHNEPDKHGIVRELTIREDIPSVTRLLELYSGLEDGTPARVPLAVYMFNETPQSQAYILAENELFKELFQSVEGGTAAYPGVVIHPIDPTRLLALRDYIKLSVGPQAHHTAIFQVDEYWARSRDDNKQGVGAPPLENMWDYLTEMILDSDDEDTDKDPFNLFGRYEVKKGRGERGLARYERFNNKHYEVEKTPQFSQLREETKRHKSSKSDGLSQSQEIKSAVYQVPFMWDFGFLLVRSGPLEMAKSERIRSFIHLTKLEKGNSQILTERSLEKYIPLLRPVQRPGGEGFELAGPSVKEILDDLVRSPLPVDGKAGVIEGTSWRKFFGACKQIAAVHFRETGLSVAPFDCASPSSETMNAFVLEVWRSEVALQSKLWGVSHELDPGALSLRAFLRGDLEEKFTIKERFEECKKTCENPESTPEERLTAFGRIPLGAFCLYKTWLLLVEVLEIEEILDPGDAFAFLQGRTASKHAVASRQWYKTACSFAKTLNSSDEIHDSLLAMRLPGSFSTRGDWSLGIARSSRSRLLGEYAIDLLSSRRANVTRLQYGLGLPVRDIVNDEAACGKMRTALKCKVAREVGGRLSLPTLTEMNYDELADLGIEGSDASKFFWQFRSKITDYDRLSRPFQKWLGRLFRWTEEYKKTRSTEWRGGFRAYDQLTCNIFDEVKQYNSFLEFAELCDSLAAELSSAERGRQIR